MKNKLSNFTFFFILVFHFGCGTADKAQEATIGSSVFGTMPDGREVRQFVLTNTQGMEMKVIEYGGIITSLTTPDRDENLGDIVLGYDNLKDYLAEPPYFGAIIGRFGNRIAKGKFTLDSVEYTLAVNNIGNHLHGGLKGFDKVLWSAREVPAEEGVALELTYTSKNMEEGYPGTLEVTVTYTLGNDNSLVFGYQAVTDKKTVVNLTQHSYFNLSAMKSDILNHEVMLNADRFLPVDSTLIPTGELRPVEGTPFDFTKAKPIGRHIGVGDQQLIYGGGFDHCWVLSESKDEMALAASVYEPLSGRTMEIYTTEPAIQFYSGNFLDGTLTGKNGAVYHHRTGFCLETQHFPDSPNQPLFPSVVLSPGNTYSTTTKLVFGSKK